MKNNLLTKFNIKLIILNLFITSISLLITLELFVRITKPKFSLWTLSESKFSRISKAIRNSQKSKDFRILVGDSHAANLIGTEYNLFDNLFECDENNPSCSYVNLSSGGTSLPNYWNDIKYSFANRKSNPNNKELIIIVISFGNDFHEYINIKYNKKDNHCPVFSNEETFHASDNTTIKKDSIKENLKRSLPSLNLIWRALKSNLNLNREINNELIKGGNELRKSLVFDPEGKLESVSSLLKNTNQEAIYLSGSDQINRWEVGLAIANPYYFDELYSLSANWAKKGIKCMKRDIKNFHDNFTKSFPNSKILYIGIPDKLIWKSEINKLMFKEYGFLGYKIDEMIDKNGVLKNKYFNLTKNMNSFFKSNNLDYIYMPSLVNNKTDISKWFYVNDMHINKEGNYQLSRLLRNSVKLKKFMNE